MWMRVVALACLLLVGVASSVQAVHVHGRWLPGHATNVGAPADASQLPGGEEHCPLCVAMHSALPVAQRVEPVRMVLVECRAAQTVDRAPDSQWHFAMFSRPPPVRGNA
jgi:hypothetical protein